MVLLFKTSVFGQGQLWFCLQFKFVNVMAVMKTFAFYLAVVCYHFVPYHPLSH